MRKRKLAVASLAVLPLVLAACGGSSGTSASTDTSAPAAGSDSSSAPAGDGAKAKIGVILPDSKSSARWETADRKFLGEAFTAAGVDFDIQNAQGDKAQFQTIADQMISSGVNVRRSP